MIHTQTVLNNVDVRTTSAETAAGGSNTEEPDGQWQHEKEQCGVKHHGEDQDHEDQDHEDHGEDTLESVTNTHLDAVRSSDELTWTSNFEWNVAVPGIRNTSLNFSSWREF